MPAKSRKRAPSKLVPFSARRKHNKKREASSAELEVYAMLKAEGIAFKKEKAISRLHVDIFIAPRTVIEVQGCYWHACPACTPAPTKAQLAKREEDGRRIYVLRNLGYDVITIWEHEIRDEPERVQAMLRGLKA